MPKKLIRKNIVEKLKPGEWEEITDPDELNDLYRIKVLEEVAEITSAAHKDVMEFVDLIQISVQWAKINGFTHEQITVALVMKSVDKGLFSNLALNNLNPNNPSNALYFSLSTQDYEEVIADHKRLVRELDVLLNGENAARQASLVDIVSQIRSSINETTWKKI